MGCQSYALIMHLVAVEDEIRVSSRTAPRILVATTCVTHTPALLHVAEELGNTQVRMGKLLEVRQLLRDIENQRGIQRSRWSRSLCRQRFGGAERTIAFCSPAIAVTSP